MMATEIIVDLDSQLASLNQLKPPGASKNRIGSITQLCVNNIQVESNVCQSLYRALKKAPATHKLGALYVIDSVVRQWIEKAKQNGQDLLLEGRGEAGTYPAAVKRITELIPALFDDVLRDIPSEQKPKLENMINIWEKGNTFPSKHLNEFRAKLNTTAATNLVSTSTTQNTGTFMAPVPSRPVNTPVGLPPQQLYDQGLLPRANGIYGKSAPGPQLSANIQPVSNAPSDVNSILAALASAVPKAAPVALQQSSSAHTPTAATFPPPAVAQGQPALQQLPPGLAAMLGQSGGNQLAQTPAFSTPPTNAFPGFAPPSNFAGYPAQQPNSIPQPFSFAAPPSVPASAADPLAPLRGILPQSIVNDHGKLVMALSLLQDLQKQGLPMDQWGPILKAFEDSTSTAQPDVAPMPAAAPTSAYLTNDAYGRGRDRSRSPQRGNRRGSPVYGNYDDLSGRQGNDNNGRDRYRQRSPVESRDDSSPIAYNGMPMQPKYIAIDNNLPSNNIKVLSRTLFVGGANGTQQEIQTLFERYGRVQTCISNRDKRHAFVKMTTRAAALAAKAGMEDLQNRNDPTIMHVARQTKWGVGFGPRECCDYQRGESIIPIHKLTEADMKWLLTAEYGGTGGKQVEGGMVVEEPDIEIGAGVSSKAMSKRIGPEHHVIPKRGMREDSRDLRRGPGAGYGGAGMGGAGGAGTTGNQGRKGRDLDGAYAGNGAGYGNGASGVPPTMEGYYPRPEPVAVATPPAVPTFGFSLPSGGGQGYR